MSRVALAVVLTSSTAWAAIGRMPLAFMAKRADLVVIGTGAAPRNERELASLKVERALKGKPAPVLAILPPADPDFLCDTTALAPGERALFFLVGKATGYFIMNFGRGKLPYVGESLLMSPHEFQLTASLAAECSAQGCSAKAVLAEIEPWLRRNEPTAFFQTKSVLTATTATRNVRCEPADGGIFRECRGVDGGSDSGGFNGDLLCFERADAGPTCLGAPLRRSQ